ncbi:MAG: Phosphoenolpyruvate-utilizing enzyme mobile region [Sphingomonadales bacterium]|nr:Phosphoenolpyruvate-utilizing enzyme mobile region [Sphingomonadales bacterium]
MSDDDGVLARFLGDDGFPVQWDSAQEQDLFWVYDDLHCPHPLSPMYFDIGGWWLSCDHMFRRFATPFAVDWLAKNVNGYLYTAAIPADPALTVGASEYGHRYAARVPLDGTYVERMGAYLDGVLPVYGEHFADWWRDRLVPEMLRNFEYLESVLDRADSLSRMELAVLLEDAIDVHDRHWKIHWMLNFAQLSATMTLRTTMEKVRGSVDEELLGRLQNSAADRNWDSVEGLWRMKEAVKKSAELTAAFVGNGAQIRAALEASADGRAFIAEQLEPYQREFGWRAVWSHEFIFPTFREQPEPILEQVRGYVETDYDYPSALETVRVDLEKASAELLEGLSGEPRAELAAANAVNLRMAPLTPDHHFYIDQGANARLRVVLITLGQRLVDEGLLDEADDVLFLRYNELRAFVGAPAAVDARALVAERRAERVAAGERQPRDWVGTVTQPQLDFPYWVNWGYPERFHRQASTVASEVVGISGSPGVVEGTARVVRTVGDFDEVAEGDILVCQMTNPAWVVLFTKISGLVTDTGGTTSHPAVLAREFGIPAVVGTSDGSRRINTGDRIRVDGTTGMVEIMGVTEPVRSAISLD